MALIFFGSSKGQAPSFGGEMQIDCKHLAALFLLMP